MNTIAHELIHGSAIDPLHYSGDSPRELLRATIEHATHLLPTQGPISVFVHHNTLHAFENLRFDQAVIEGLHAFGGQPYWSEERFRAALCEGRILTSELAKVLIDDLGDSGDELLGFFGTRFHLRMAMLEHPMQLGTDAELAWFIAETEALRRFRPECDPGTRSRMIDSVKRLARQIEQADPTDSALPIHQFFRSVAAGHHRGQWQSWDDATWEAVTLNILWQSCELGIREHLSHSSTAPRHEIPVRHRDFLLAATGHDIDLNVNPLLISFTGAFLDQGLATWSLPNRDAGYFQSFLELFSSGLVATEAWRDGLDVVVRRLLVNETTAYESIEESLQTLGVSGPDLVPFIAETLKPLRGWAGMAWQLETVADWTARPAQKGTLVEFLAVRLLLECVALKNLAASVLRDRRGHSESFELADLRTELLPYVDRSALISDQQHLFLVFELAQVRGWLPENIAHMSTADWTSLFRELDAFSTLQRRRVYHLAFEAQYRDGLLGALTLHAKQNSAAKQSANGQGAALPKFQVVCCIDDREESFRRHLEEVEPACETFGVAGFFAIAIYYKGVAEASFRPLCPAVIRPQHYIIEEVSYSLESSHRTRAKNRKRMGAASRRWHLGSRTLVGGMATSLLGSLAAAPMVGRILFPRLTAQIKRIANSFIQPPAITRLTLERTEPAAGPEEGHLGFTVEEMASIVKRILEDMGVVGRLSRLVIFFGHGSASLNNPHESAYNCGACSGARGGPNARSFAQMANDPRVRRLLAERGVVIADQTVFVGGLHNTCDDDVVYFDLDDIPPAHRRDFEAARDAVEEARGRNALERCRRFESADRVRSADEALRHVETRSEDLSQARPEYNHATCAALLVGRRESTRGLFLDRRSFLVSYDPTTDNDNHDVLARILGAAIPVCAGISLEYYFSCVDPVAHGCGSKLPHNIAALLGVMEGAASDLRTGLSQQMVEIHEPMRILAVIEATPATMFAIMKGNPTIDLLVRNGWVQLAVIDPTTKQTSLFQGGEFVPNETKLESLATAASSVDWHRNQRHHLDLAQINSHHDSSSAAVAGLR